MNNSQKVLVGTIVLLVAVIMFPPFHFVSPNGGTYNQGFAWIFDAPMSGNATVNAAQLFIQVLVVLAVSVAAWLFVKAK